jgi:GNAT superfamily N-acetyltransferase
MTNRTVQIADHEETIRACWPVFRELRPHIGSPEEFVARCRQQEAEGYRIAYVADGPNVVAAAGFRFLHTLAWGKVLYIDDLVAAERVQGTGLGVLLLDYLQREARERGCDAVHLDTGFHRKRAHRTYLRSGFEHEAFHMARRV